MQISMMEAFIIESLKTKYDYEQVEQQLNTRDLSLFKDFNVDLTLIQKLYDNNPTELKEAYTNTYTVKFLTINGLKNILRLRYGLNEENYDVQEFGLYGITVDTDTEKAISSILSSNWKITRDGEKINLFV
ncbi:hypothetical protein [Solibacillus sp. CAU 1738]|uniref:hypothetical protein n=1 Tax=Solibacillus sp. CAU 1738 TaxID=3140363 RepID=UPI0032604580